MNDDSKKETVHLPPLPENVSYIKTLCPLCGGSIEFPEHGAGQWVECPHCIKKIQLQGPSNKNPLVAFLAGFFLGPLGFFYVSWRAGVAALLAFVPAFASAVRGWRHAFTSVLVQ
jgi:hypothetical protein